MQGPPSRGMIAAVSRSLRCHLTPDNEITEAPGSISSAARPCARISAWARAIRARCSALEIGTTEPVIGRSAAAACWANSLSGANAASPAVATPAAIKLRLLSIGASGPMVGPERRLRSILEHEIRRHEGDGVADEDAEIGRPVAVDVALDPGVGAVEIIAQLGRGAGKGGGADEREGLVARAEEIGVHPRNIDQVGSLNEVEDSVGTGAEAGLERGDGEGVGAVAAGQIVGAGIPVEAVVAVAAEQDVVAAAAVERVVAAEAAERVGAAAAADVVV